MVSIENTELFFSTTNSSWHLWPEVQKWNLMQRLEFLFSYLSILLKEQIFEIFIPEK